MEPRIQYAQTKDGVSIAFWTLGQGPPLLRMQPTPWTHVLLEWKLEEFSAWYESLAQHFELIRFDHRGCGLSQRNVIDFSPEAQARDLQAVLDRLHLRDVVLVGSYGSGPLAISYAVSHPERVSHLILWDAYARAADFYQVPQAQAVLAMIDKDWELFTETAAHVGYGWSEESARRYAAFMRDCATPDVVKAFVEADAKVDMTSALSEVKQPTLVIQHRRIPFPTMDTARELTSAISDARLLFLDGTWADMDIEAVTGAIAEFLGEGVVDAAAEAAKLAPEDIHTILFTDVEGSTALTQRLGDARARDLLREHERMVREALKAHGGSEVKTMGDGFMASFSSATKALECAIAMQRAFAEHNESAEEPINVRIGLNAGEPIAEHDDLFGTAVNLAARICAHAEAGQILAPIVVRELAAGKQFLFADLGETELRGFEDPVRLYELSWRDG